MGLCCHGWLTRSAQAGEYRRNLAVEAAIGRYANTQEVALEGKTAVGWVREDPLEHTSGRETLGTPLETTGLELCGDVRATSAAHDLHAGTGDGSADTRSTSHGSHALGGRYGFGCPEIEPSLRAAPYTQ